MSITQLTSVLESTVALVLLLVLQLRLWPRQRCDAFRQKLFAIRDELFDYAAAGNISFDDPAYRLLRQSMNGFIRYAHRLTFYRLFFNMLHWKMMRQEPDIKWTRDWERALQLVEDERVKQGLQEFHQKTLLAVTQHLVSGSPVLMFVALVALIFIPVKVGWDNFRRVREKAATKAVSRFVDTRLLEEEAARA